MTELITFDSVSKYFHASGGMFEKGERFAALDNISFTLKKGSSLGIVGESGSGKTTIARLICGVYAPDSGKISFRGRELGTFDNNEHKNYRRNVQMVFQDPYNSLNPKLTIRSALSDGIKRHITRNNQETEDRLAKLMDMVGFPHDYLNRYPHEFSGGQRQRISIARALSLEPELIIADEPVSSLDVSVQAQILNLMDSLKKEGVTFILISHSLAVVSFLCEETAVMRKGILTEQGSTHNIMENPKSDYTKQLIDASNGFWS